MSEDATMFASKPRGPRIIYVAASARELPDEVQQWLGRAEHRAASSPHIYDALALLAGGARPALLIVSMEAVDWNEMEFFDQAARISRETHLYVTGHAHRSAKLEAACRRGAILFEPMAASESLANASSWSRGTGVSDVLVASLRPPAGPGPTTTAPIRPLAPGRAEFDEPQQPEGKAQPERPAGDGRPPASSFEAEIDMPDRAEAPLQDAGRLARLVPDSGEPAGASPAESSTPAVPTVRLLHDADTGSEVQDSDGPIPFPWAPSPSRPQRTPPKPRPANSEPAGPAPLAPRAAPSAPAPISRQVVELTPEELSALMGRPIAPEKQAKEGK